ncbi:proton-conducting membrane transporter [Rubrobacter taiwanensis]|uniref:Proton-conducting membrane transporter n=1 Tax=Rubrobacter taiwanensis TaxID=185139 RepID=A0A4R1BTU1_9ACTN|nr:proton-conducting membrane transporter [Rubrobacter taiwanensis]TCJ20705.1 proton-conducting membrane transporter [Rubrobacter taiwanensis]
MVEFKQRTLEEVKSLGRKDAVELMRQAGIVGAGGGGFPTYFKYANPQPRLIVNCTESEPGYWADKVLHRDFFDEFMRLYEALRAVFGFERIIMGVHFKDEEWFSRYIEHAGGLYEVKLVPDKYSMGEEKTLIKNIFREDREMWVPRRVEMPDGTRRPGLPPDAGHIVNNTETLLNVYRAWFEGRPVTTKWLQVYGPDLPLKLYEVPLGASATELLTISGVDVEKEAGRLSVIDGGPYLNEMGIESLGEGDAFVRRTTNGFLVIPKGVPSKEYGKIETRLPEEGAISLVGKVSGVVIPLGGRFLTPARPLVSEGEEVSYEQKLGEPVDEGLSIGVWSSMDGTVSSIEDGVVTIDGGGAFTRGAGAEAGAARPRE